jgi:hypothetical protein
MGKERPNSGDLQRFVKKHKMALIAGALVLVLIASGGEDPGAQTGSVQPFDGGAAPPIASTTTGEPGVDMDAWERENRRDDQAQEKRVDTIREVERCYDPATGGTVEVSIHVGCP